LGLQHGFPQDGELASGGAGAEPSASTLRVLNGNSPRARKAMHTDKRSFEVPSRELEDDNA
jgi:hypothetical protein